MELDKVYDKSICSLVNFLYLLSGIPVDLQYAQHKINVVKVQSFHIMLILLPIAVKYFVVNK